MVVKVVRAQVVEFTVGVEVPEEVEAPQGRVGKFLFFFFKNPTHWVFLGFIGFFWAILVFFG